LLAIAAPLCSALIAVPLPFDGTEVISAAFLADRYNFTPLAILIMWLFWVLIAAFTKR